MKSLAHFLPQQSQVPDHRNPSYQRVRFIEELKSRWHLLLGEGLARECWPLWIRQHTLWVGTPSPLVAQELGFYADDLLNKIKEHLGATAGQLCLKLQFMAMSETQWSNLDRKNNLDPETASQKAQQMSKAKIEEMAPLTEQEKHINEAFKLLRDELS